MKTLKDIMNAVGCEKWPERWETFYEEEMKEFERSGCRYLKPEYYDEIAEKYGILQRYREVYKDAAREIAKDDDLARLLVVLCRALQDRENFRAELGVFTKPASPGGVYSFAYEMLTGLVMCSGLDYCYGLLKARKLPEEVISSVLNYVETGVYAYVIRNDGRYGYEYWTWFQLSIDGKLFDMERLQFEIFAAFKGNACVFEDKNGKKTALADGVKLHKSGNVLGSIWCEEETDSWTADITETGDYWEGYPYNEDGRVCREKVRLMKSDWIKVLANGDPVISLHIPVGGGLTPEKVERSLAQGKEFVARYYPDYQYKAFICGSWLMDTQLIPMVGEDSNIAKFNKRFYKLTQKSMGTGVFSFVYLMKPTQVPLEELPENTTLERKLKSHYLDNKAIYELLGYFFP